MLHSFLKLIQAHSRSDLNSYNKILSYSEFKKQQKNLDKKSYFQKKTFNLSYKLNEKQHINNYKFASSLIHTQTARSYPRYSIKRYLHKKHSIDDYYHSLNVKQAKLRWKNAFLGFSIWSWSGLKNTNISGFRSLALSIGKLILSGFIAPSFGAKYIDIPVAVSMGLYSDGMPVLNSICKNAPTFEELIEENKQIKLQQKFINLYKGYGLTKDIHHIKREFEKHKNQFEIKKKSPNNKIKYALRINSRYRLYKEKKIQKQQYEFINLYELYGLTKDIRQIEKDLEERKRKFKLNKKLQNDNLKYALKGNWRSAARLGTLGAIIGLIISSGGISLLANGLIMGIGHFIYAIACGIDTDVQNNYTIWLNLKRANFFKDDIKQEDIDIIFDKLDKIIDNIIKKTASKKEIKVDLDKICMQISKIIDENKVKKTWLRSNEVLKGSIKDIYTYESSLLCKDINGIINNTAPITHKNINKLEQLASQIYLFEINKIDKLDENEIIGKCLKSKFYLNRKSVTAAKHATNNWYGQAAKNFGTSNISTTLNAIAEAAYYSPLHTINKDVSNGIFTAGKTSAGFSAAAVRSLSSAKRSETKKIFELDLGDIQTIKLNRGKDFRRNKYINYNNDIEAILTDIDYATNKNGNKIITTLYFEIIDKYSKNKQVISVPVILFSPQSNQFNPTIHRYKNLAKASWVSTKAAYSIPRDVIILNYWGNK